MKNMTPKNRTFTESRIAVRREAGHLKQVWIEIDPIHGIVVKIRRRKPRRARTGNRLVLLWVGGDYWPKD
jgi:hypothetical protein